jgi:hypothetical protein
MCVWPQSNKRYVTRDPALEAAIVGDINYKLTNTSEFSWPLHDLPLTNLLKPSGNFTYRQV